MIYWLVDIVLFFVGLYMIKEATLYAFKPFISRAIQVILTDSRAKKLLEIAETISGVKVEVKARVVIVTFRRGFSGRYRIVLPFERGGSDDVSIDYYYKDGSVETCGHIRGTKFYATAKDIGCAKICVTRGDKVTTFVGDEVVSI